VSKPSRVQWTVLVGSMVIVTLVAYVLVCPASSASAGVVTTTTVPCSGPRLTTDYQIDHCLESKIQMKTDQMNSLLRKESVYFHYANRAADLRVAKRTQSTFMSYARQECLAQANPYQPGTIVPFIYGECVLNFYDQRLVVLHNAITSFAKGGEARGKS
jgi:uncharacterized protein YecT (DUF1311 family)